MYEAITAFEEYVKTEVVLSCIKRMISLFKHKLPTENQQIQNSGCSTMCYDK